MVSFIMSLYGSYCCLKESNCCMDEQMDEQAFMKAMANDGALVMKTMWATECCPIYNENTTGVWEQCCPGGKEAGGGKGSVASLVGVFFTFLLGCMIQ